jgi:predicted MFS family arabinose efflux permease
MMGIFTGASAAGQVIGPAVGGLAVAFGRAGVFALVGGAALVFAAVGLRFPAPTVREGHSLSGVVRAHRGGVVWLSDWLVAMPTLLLGSLLVLTPLRLSALGFDAAHISGVFVVAAVAGVGARPVAARWADRRGLSDALQILLVAPVAVLMIIPWVGNAWVLGVVVVVAMTAAGVLLGPVMAVASHLYESAGVSQIFGFALMGVTLGGGFFLGSAGGGTVADLFGDAAAYIAISAVLVCTAALLFYPWPGLPKAREPAVIDAG